MPSLWTHRRRLPLASAVAILLTAGTVVAPAPAHAEPKTPAPADPVASAIGKARDEGDPIPVPSLTDEYSTTSANPDGSLTAIYSSAPQRVKQDGAWVPVDTTLVKRKDGTFGPRAANTELSISGGGGTSLLSMSDGKRKLAFSWTGKLPTPVVSGDTATYRDVLPDVDLQVIADATGYSSMLVVKTPEAAADPALQKIDFGLSGTGVKLAETANGGAEAIDTKSGERIFHTDTALMWDSTPEKGAPAPPTGADLTPQEARIAAGSLGRNRAKVQVGIAGGKQTLVPDRKLLTAKSTKFPVYIDPYWSGSPSKSQLQWARISSNGWNVYNSTSTTGATSARVGWDNWAGGGGERARTYYQMNTAGIKGAEIYEANMYVVHRWSASCYNTASVIYGVGAIASWNASGLYWGKEPLKKTGVLSTVNAQELDCGTSKVRPSPASLNFNVLGFIKPLAAGQSNNATFMVEAKNMNDAYHWKQLGYGGGATLSVRYSYKPKFTNGTGNPQVTPSVVDQGRIVTTSRTPTLTAHGYSPKMNGHQENVRITYQVFDNAGTQIRTGYGPGSGYNLNGSAWTVTPALGNGTYSWRASIKNESGLDGGVWSQGQTFHVDTEAPKAPPVVSAQFPPDMMGGSYTDPGVFQFANDRTNNVVGYLFSLDGDLANVTYAANKGTAWTAATVPTPGKVYFATADNAAGTGTAVINGTAGVRFAPGTAGAHRVFVKAVDQGGSTSPQTTYSFYAGTTSPFYAAGNDMVTGWTANNTDGTTTVVPPATLTSTGGFLKTQPSYPGWYFHTGQQGMLADIDTTRRVAVGDSAVFQFNIPAAGVYELGASLMTATNYGVYNLTLDKGWTSETPLVRGFDAYNARNSVTFRNFGIAADSGGTARVLHKGLHTITLTVIGKNAASGGHMAGLDVLRLAPVPTCSVDNTTSCLNNTAISTLTEGTTPSVTRADADGGGSSFEAAHLKAAGWNPGGTVNVNGAPIKLPATFGDGRNDNMLSSGQIVTVPPTGVVNRGNAVVFVGFTTNGPIRDATGTITYAQTSCGMKSQSFTLQSLADWTTTPASETVFTAPTANKGTATRSAVPISMFATSVPLACPGAVVSGITLPLVTNVAQAGRPALHLLGLGIRQVSTAGGDRWVGSWAAAQDTAVVQSYPTPGAPTVDATLDEQTVRVPVHLSIGTRGPQKVRIRVANSLGKTPITLDSVSIAPRADGAAAASAPVALRFSGSKSITLAAGADIVSDPVPFSAPDRAVVLLSAKVRGKISKVPGHQDGKTPVYLSAADGVDRTLDTAGTGFSTSTVTGIPFLAGVDVTTPADKPSGALVLYGDHTVNADTVTATGEGRLDSRIAEQLFWAPNGSGTVPFGVLNLGSSAWANRGQLPSGGAVTPENAIAAVDRAILNQSNVRTVLISAGSSDLLACTATTADACATAVQTKLIALTSQLRKVKTDDANTSGVVLQNKTGGLRIYVATLPPFAKPATPVQEAARKLVNEFIAGTAPGSDQLQGYADDVINFAAAVSVDGDHLSDRIHEDYLWRDSTSVFPSDFFYVALAKQYLADADPSDWIVDDPTPVEPAVAEWKLGEGSGTDGRDTGWGVGPDRGLSHAKLHDVAWADGRLTGRKAARFDGTGSYGDTGLLLNTTRSFTVSAWARLTDKSADRTVIARGGDGNSALYFQYQQSSDHWRAVMPSAATGADVVWHNAESSTVARTGVWTHLAAVYDAELKSLTLYVDGAADTSAADVTPFADLTVPTWIGRGAGSWFAGDLAEVRVWNRAVNDAEVSALAQPEMTANWQFEDDSDATIAKDWSFHGNDGRLTGGAAYTYPGHPSFGDIGAVRLNGGSAHVTSKPLLRTDQSFSVAAWARLTTADQRSATVLSQEGDHTGRFMLQRGGDCACWRVVMTGSDSVNPAVTVAQAPAGVQLNTWTHLAATYDVTTGRISLYVNGELSGEGQSTGTPWHAGGSFTAGRTRWNDQAADFFPGDLDAVHVYQGVITPETVKELGTV
ncbi:LamG-like jellyroll fold domain-containing protein [Actinoplanes couchii]|nr:LamG-like jellyroll fold domain-containing protein [Actinoplanes couchii]MDR6325886.1 hypothetical protein [Actinoplanes couchii]